MKIYIMICEGYYDGEPQDTIIHAYATLERYHRDTDRLSRYRLADILKAVNSVSAEQYDDVEIFS